MDRFIQLTGLVWYAEEDFAEIKALMIDGHKLHGRYADWQLAAENGERQLRTQGIQVIRAHLKPAAFKDWCATHGHELDAKGRTAFANWCAKEAHVKAQG
mgnify:CR=1 FL=1